MGVLDWIVLIASLVFIVGWGTYKNRCQGSLDQYLVSSRETAWYTVAISIMATQASAITFLSTPGQAYADGMRFVQFYFGLPLAMVVLCVTFVPMFHRLKVYTAYEFLEKRFDLKTRSLGAFLFLFQRGLSTGVSIYATSIVLSVLLGWNVYTTNLVIGGLVIVYTTVGGSRAVNWTQTHQFLIAILGMAVAFVVIVRSFPANVSFPDALYVAGTMGRLNTVDTTLDFTNRYNIWSGLIGGFFLSLSYFGTDQSQVGRYLGGRSVTESRLGLLFNGLLKVPMQFAILGVGLMVFVFYQFTAPPVFFNPVETRRLENGPKAAEFKAVSAEHARVYAEKNAALQRLLTARKAGDTAGLAAAQTDVRARQAELEKVRAKTVSLLKTSGKKTDTNDTNYVFLTFVLNHLPTGLVGLILAVVFAAAMSSNSAALNALASSTVVDVTMRFGRKDRPDEHTLFVSKLATIFWGLVAVACSMFANRMGTLVEAVNILGSLVYGTMLGMFLLAFYVKRVGGTACFVGGLCGLASVVWCFASTKLSFLWYNVVGCFVVVLVALAVQAFLPKEPLRVLDGSRPA